MRTGSGPPVKARAPPAGPVIVTICFGIGPAILAALVGLLVFDFVFVPPALAFAVPDARDGSTLAVMLVVAALTGLLAEHLRRQVRDARRRVEIEGLRNALLSAVSHDLRTPLTALVGASTALHEERLDPLERREFSRIVAVEATRLHRLVSNLLDLTRLASGRATANRTLQAIDEVIGAALCRLERPLQGRRVRTDVPVIIPLKAATHTRAWPRTSRASHGG
jgi:K+-sensing histidine kinase KdpD